MERQTKKEVCEVKICGITQLSEAAMLCKRSVNYAGMVLFYPKSHRNITLERAIELIQFFHLHNHKIRLTAVTVSPTVEQIKLICAAGFDLIQIHGEMSEKVYLASQLPIIRAIPIDLEQEQAIGSAYYITQLNDQIDQLSTLDQVYGILIDHKTPGSGMTFDWGVMKKICSQDKKLFLAGGLTPKNVAEAIAKVGPDVVDVSSGVEQEIIDENGQHSKIKSDTKIEMFISNVKYKL